MAAELQTLVSQFQLERVEARVRPPRLPNGNGKSGSNGKNGHAAGTLV
jgi:hypothetical protein